MMFLFARKNITAIISSLNLLAITIALRTGKADYHFMLQHDDGTWSHKPGMAGTRLINGNNPSVVSWDMPIYHRGLYNVFGIVSEIGAIENYYDSDTIYFAVTR